MVRRTLYLFVALACLIPSVGCWGSKQEPIQKKDVNFRERMPQAPNVPAEKPKK